MKSIKHKSGIGNDPSFHSAIVGEVSLLLKVLSSRGLCAFPDYGTLLGVVRDKRLIEWDDDADVSLLAPPRVFNPLAERVFADLKRAGFSLVSSQSRPRPTRPTDAVRSGRFVAMRKTIPIDVFLWVQANEEGKWKRVRYLTEDHKFNKGLDLHDQWIGKLVNAEVCGGTLPCPEKSGVLLEHRYGKDWKTPTPYRSS